jgi:biopolymer transport protein ExbD
MLTRGRFIKRTFKKEDSVSLLPFIGVFFIFAIPFMAARNSNITPLKVELPSVDYKIVVLESEPIKVYINNEGVLYVDNSRVQLGSLTKTIDEISLKNLNRNIYVLADTSNNYGFVLRVVNTLRTSGYKNVNLVGGVYNNFR